MCQHREVRRRWLGKGEQEIVTLRPHASALFFPVILLLVFAVLAGAGIRAVPSERPELLWVLLGVQTIAIVLFVVRPLVRWSTTRYVLTSHRMLTRVGVLGRLSRSIPLISIAHVIPRRRLVDRLTGAGTVRVATVDGYLIDLRQVPDLKRLLTVVNELRSERSLEWSSAGSRE